MKTILCISFLILFITTVTATPVLNLERTTVQPQETLIGKIYTSGQFQDDITKQDIKFYEGRKQVFFEYELYRYNNEYYLYVIFNREGVFTIETNEILYTLANEVGSKAISEEVTVAYTNGNESSEPSQLLSIEPGIIYTFSETSSLSLYNRGSNALSVDVGGQSLSLEPYQATTVTLSLTAPLSFVNVNTYQSFAVPVIFLGASLDNQENSSNETIILTSNVVANPGEIIENVSANSTQLYTIELANLGNVNISSLYVISNISQAVITAPYNISAGNSEFLTIEIFTGISSREEEIIINYIENDTEFNLTIPLSLNIITLPEDNNSQNNNNTLGLTCLDLGGSLCNGECVGESNFTSDGYCCYGECQSFQVVNGGEQEEPASYGWLVGILIFVVIGIIGYIIFSQYKKTKAESPNKKIEESKEKFENRLKGPNDRTKNAVTRH